MKQIFICVTLGIFLDCDMYLNLLHICPNKASSLPLFPRNTGFACQKAFFIFNSVAEVLPVAHPKHTPSFPVDPQTTTDYWDRYCRNFEAYYSTDFCSTENSLLLHSSRPCQISSITMIETHRYWYPLPGAEHCENPYCK